MSKNNHNPIKERHVVVTGASRGIGEAVARRLVSLGAKVSLLGLEPDAMAKICDELGENAHAIEVDVSDRNAMQKALHESYENFGAIDTLIANAGIYNVSTLLDDEFGAFEKTINVNLFGVYNTIKEAKPYMQRGRGYILTVSSMAALTNGPLMGAYAASKAAVEALTNSLRLELANEGIAVGCAYFGAIDTDLVQGGKLHPALNKLEKAFPNVIRQPISVEKAVDVMVAGIDQRSHRIWAPKWLGAFLVLRGVAQPIMEWQVARSKYLLEALNIQKDSNRVAPFNGVALGISAAKRK